MILIRYGFLLASYILMVVLSVAYPLFPVSADASGGAEQILYLVEKGIVDAGHRSIVIAAKGSLISGTLMATEAGADEMTADDRIRAQKEHQKLVTQMVHSEAVDVVHFHGLDFETYAPDPSVPMVATLHLPPSWYAPAVFALAGVDLVCVSRSQAKAVPNGRAVTVIENGIEEIVADADSVRGESLLWLGRICPEKGTHIALQVAHRLDCAITIAGPVHGFASHREYFHDQIEPLLDDKRRYIGAVGRPEKARLLRRAKALLVPSLAPETSSLVSMEAISAGTPVVAFASGALPEVVEDRVSGFIVQSADEMCEAIGRLSELRMGGKHFSAGRMVAEYLQLYERVIRTRHLGVGTAPQEAL